jgi:hypothetical protein
MLAPPQVTRPDSRGRNAWFIPPTFAAATSILREPTIIGEDTSAKLYPSLQHRRLSSVISITLAPWTHAHMESVLGDSNRTSDHIRRLAFTYLSRTATINGVSKGL